MTKPIDNKNLITAIILAGGKSERMGKDKALLEINGQPLLTRTCQIASQCARQTYVVTPWIDKYFDVVPSSCRLIKERLILDGASNTPIIGLTQGMELVETGWVLLLACDLPRLSVSQVKQWSSTLTTVLPTEVAYLPRNDKGWEPLCGFYRRDCLPLLEAYIHDGGSSFQTWLNRHPVRKLSVGDRTCLFNCNTPEDWKLIIDRDSEFFQLGSRN